MLPAMNEASIVEIEGVRTAILREPSSESEARVALDLGANVYRYRTALGDVLAEPADMATLRERPTRWGSACLFPFPGRIQGGQFSFAGRSIQLPVDVRDGNAIHGVVRKRAWRAIRLGAADGDGAFAQARISTAEAAIPTAEWPWPFELTLTVSLRGGALRMHTEARNTGVEPMPIGLGFHPYFPITNRTEVWIDATEEWGQGAGLPNAERRAIGPGDWPRKPMAIGQILPDSQSAEGPVRNRLVRRQVRGPSDAPGGISAGLRDVDRNMAVTMRASAGFGRMVFFTPAAPPLVSLEPQTCVPNAHRLAGEGRDDAGLVVLRAGESWRGWWELRAEALRP